MIGKQKSVTDPRCQAGGPGISPGPGARNKAPPPVTARIDFEGALVVRPGDLVDDDQGCERRIAPRRCKKMSVYFAYPWMTCRFLFPWGFHQ